MYVSSQASGAEYRQDGMSQGPSSTIKILEIVMIA